jgi:hypothetical protein
MWFSHRWIKKGTIFWDVTPCSLVECCRRFGSAHCFHLQNKQARNQQEEMFTSFLVYSSTLKVEEVHSSNPSVTYHTARCHVPRFSITTVRTSYPTRENFCAQWSAVLSRSNGSSLSRCLRLAQRQPNMQTTPRSPNSSFCCSPSSAPIGTRQTGDRRTERREDRPPFSSLLLHPHRRQ